MKFDINLVYHVYNQGNNKVPIFYKTENYFYFLKKIRKHVYPYADVICYCLMPNHFHLLIKPKELGVLPSSSINKFATDRMKLESDKDEIVYKNNLSHQLGIMLSSYTRAINIQESRTGSLFRGSTKARNGWEGEVLSVGKRNFEIGDGYEITCFNYIHNNPVKAGIVKKPTDWVYSSAKEYAGLRNGTLCNLDLGERLLTQY